MVNSTIHAGISPDSLFSNKFKIFSIVESLKPSGSNSERILSKSYNHSNEPNLPNILKHLSSKPSRPPTSNRTDPEPSQQQFSMTQQRKNARNPKQQEARGPLWYIQRLIIKEQGMNKKAKPPLSDEDERSEDGTEAHMGKKGSSLWHRMKWMDDIVRLLITVVSYVGEDVDCTNDRELLDQPSASHFLVKYTFFDSSPLP
jgi:hypothetical protein